MTLVDLDPEMTDLFTKHLLLKKLNSESFSNPRVKVINADAFVWLDQNQEVYDFVVIDFPDPTNYSLGKLYTTAFYRLLSRHVARGGRVVVQSTSPLFARQSFWSIANTLKQAGFHTWPYHVYVPSFGEWGYILAGAGNYQLPTRLPAGLRFLDLKTLPQLFVFPQDMAEVPADANRLNDQALVRYYEKEWREIVH